MRTHRPVTSRLALWCALSLGLLGCAQTDLDAPPPTRAAQALGQLDAVGNPVDLAQVGPGLIFSQTGGCGSGFKCACDVQWAYAFTNISTDPLSQAAFAVAKVDAPASSQLAFSVQVCKIASGAPDCANGLVASGGPVNQGDAAAAKWITFDLTPGTSTLGWRERAALVVTSVARQSSCASGQDTQTITLPDIGPDLPLGPDGFSDNQLWFDTGTAWRAEPSEPSFAVRGDRPTDAGPFYLGMGTPYNGGRVLDGIDTAGLGQSFGTIGAMQVYAVGVAIEPKGTPAAPATGSIIDLDGGVLIGGLSFDTDDDGGSFRWANLPSPALLAPGGYQLLLDRAGTGPDHWNWHRDVVQADPAPGNTAPDLASYGATFAKALNKGDGDDYAFLLAGVVCRGGEICGDGLDNDCDGVPDDGCPTSSSSGSTSAGGSGSTSTGTATTGTSASSSSGAGSTGTSSSSGASSSTTGTSSSSSTASGTTGASSSSSGSSTGGTGSSAGGTSSSSSGSSSSSSTGGSSSSGTSAGSTSSGASSGGGTLGGSATGGNPLPEGPDKFALSGCGCTTLADPGFGAVAFLLLGLRRRKRG